MHHRVGLIMFCFSILNLPRSPSAGCEWTYSIAGSPAWAEYHVQHYCNVIRPSRTPVDRMPLWSVGSCSVNHLLGSPPATPTTKLSLGGCSRGAETTNDADIYSRKLFHRTLSHGRLSSREPSLRRTMPWPQSSHLSRACNRQFHTRIRSTVDN